jgi:hypothetical protein
MTSPERLVFASQLRSALSSPAPAQHVGTLLRDIFLADWPVDSHRDQWLVRRVAERIDAAGGDDSAIVALAGAIERLLSHATSDESVELLLDLVVQRERFLSVARKYLAGTISRTNFLSFVAEQRWPDAIRRRVSTMPDPELTRLASTLEQQDFALVERIVGA